MNTLGRRRIITVMAAYLCVIALYLSFFSYSVTPAKPSEVYDFVIDEGRYSSLPSVYQQVYTNGKGLLAIATIRTISAPNSAYSAAFERLDTYVEDHAREQYGVEIDIQQESSDDAFSIAGHTGVKFTYSVNKEIQIGYPPFLTTESIQIAELGAIAWFCNVDFESIILFYLTPLYFDDEPALAVLSDQVFSMVGEVRCH